jgi:HK97 family phage prohead protease
MKEIRKLDLQFRAEDTEDNKMEIKGYAVVFNSPETYGYTEVISDKALDEADMSDVVLRYNHNDSFMVLARTRNKSLSLEKDEKGLMIDAVLQDDITDHRNIFNAIKSGLIDKQSFAFSVEEDEYDYDTDTRTITKIGKLFDVSVVDQPFYNATDVSVARGQNDEFLEKRKELREQHEKELEEKKKKDELARRKQEVLAKLG